jgi:hypothetical protein
MMRGNKVWPTNENPAQIKARRVDLTRKNGGGIETPRAKEIG